MHRAKVFNKVTKKGTVLKIVKEHYLRDDVVCGSKVRAPLCRLRHGPPAPRVHTAAHMAYLRPTGMHGVPDGDDGRGPGRVAGGLGRAAGQAALPRAGHQRLHQPGP